MTLLRKTCLFYTVALLAAASINYIPGLTDENGLAFGIFALDPFDDALHVVSALWALAAALISHRAAKIFLVLFGALYLADGVFGIFTAYGFLDLAIFSNPSEGFSLETPRILANLPHIGLGGFALFAGLRLDPERHDRPRGRLVRWMIRLFLVVALIGVGFLAPIAYNEVACIPNTKPDEYVAILPPEHHRSEARTLLTYPEWHIVHAYDDYAQVIATGDPHEFGFIQAIRGYWSSLCALSHSSADHGGFDTETKRLVYVIGVSFTAELLAKAAYEETLGRLFTRIRGETRSALDDASASHARSYADFLQQVPWHQWDFLGDRADLDGKLTDSTRDSERRVALGLEYTLKAAYAKVIANAVAELGPDETSLRMVVAGLAPNALEELDGVRVIGPLGDGIEIETPRYRALTGLLDRMAGQGARFVEIAGNDDILLTGLSQSADIDGAVHSFARQGYGDHRHLVLVKVAQLADRLRAMQAGSGSNRLRLEHIHDY